MVRAMEPAAFGMDGLDGGALARSPFAVQGQRVAETRQGRAGIRLPVPPVRLSAAHQAAPACWADADA